MHKPRMTNTTSCIDYLLMSSMKRTPLSLISSRVNFMQFAINIFIPLSSPFTKTNWVVILNTPHFEPSKHFVICFHGAVSLCFTTDGCWWCSWTPSEIVQMYEHNSWKWTKTKMYFCKFFQVLSVLSYLNMLKCFQAENLFWAQTQ